MLARIRKAIEKKDEGFTLIELLVVMIIIGILAAIAIPVFLNQRKKAVDTGIKSDLHTVANELESYYTDYQAYPGTTATLAYPSGTIGSDTVALSDGDSVTITYSTDKSAYCITGTNQKTANAWNYESDKGGLLKLGTACTLS